MSVDYPPKKFIHNYYHDVIFFEKLKYQRYTAQNRRSGEMVNRLFETYKNSVMPYGNHMFHTESDIAMATMCEYPSSKYELPHWKCVLSCCALCPRVDLTSPEKIK